MTNTIETLSKDQKNAFNSIILENNVFLTGNAGSGKSYTLNKAVEYLKSKNKNVVTLATTGIAAINIEGQTIHSFFSLKLADPLTKSMCTFVRRHKRQIWNSSDVIIIDEVSMLRPDVLDAIEWTLEKNSCNSLKTKQLIFTGDMKQLPPVVKDINKFKRLTGYSGTTFLDSYIYQELDVQEINLTKIHRQSDPVFIENLNKIRNRERAPYFKQFVTKEKSGIVLTPHVRTAETINEEMLNKLKGKKYVFQPFVTKDNDRYSLNDLNLKENLCVKSGCSVMYTINDDCFVNGQIGTLTVEESNINEIRHIVLLFKANGKTKVLEKYKFQKIQYTSNYGEIIKEVLYEAEQYPIKLAYAITIHKSQGLTFDEITIDLTKACFAEGQLYTALSRVRSPEGLKIIQ